MIGRVMIVLAILVVAICALRRGSDADPMHQVRRAGNDAPASGPASEMLVTQTEFAGAGSYQLGATSFRDGAVLFEVHVQLGAARWGFLWRMPLGGTSDAGAELRAALAASVRAAADQIPGQARVLWGQTDADAWRNRADVRQLLAGVAASPAILLRSIP